MSGKVIVIGLTDIGRRACAAISENGNEVIHLGSPSDAELRELLTDDISGVAIMLHNDIESLRYSLTIEHIRPGIRLFVAIFDRSVRHELERMIPNCFIASPAYVASPTIIASMITGHHAIKRTGPTANLSWETIDLDNETARFAPFRVSGQMKRQRISAYLSGQLRTYDFASRALLTGLFALMAMLITDAAILHQHLPIPEAFYSAAAVISGVTAPELPHETWQFLQSGTFMLLTIIFVAMFGAGVVNHILQGRRVGIVGRRVVPKRHHVVIVGLGQVGIRLCKELKLLKVPVVAIEHDENARGVLFARDMNIPVVIGNASDVRTLRRANLSGAKALLAMTSSEQENISVAVAARTLLPEIPISLRAGTNDAIEETKSLFSIGTVTDVNGLTAAYVASSLLDQTPKVIIPRSSKFALVTEENHVQMKAMPGRCDCH